MQRDVFSLLHNNVSVSVGSRSVGREYHSFGAQAAKLRGPKLEVRQASMIHTSDVLPQYAAFRTDDRRHPGKSRTL